MKEDYKFTKNRVQYIDDIINENKKRTFIFNFFQIRIKHL